ncbi:MAG: RNA polymerase sigma factor [Oscillospiraceae bacterium]
MTFISAFDTEDEKSKFEKIYYKYRDMLYACALKIVKNSADAEDVLHDAFIKTAKSIKQIDDIGSRRTAAYLTVITKNTAYDRLRRLKGLMKRRSIPVNSQRMTRLLRSLPKNGVRRPDCRNQSVPTPYNEVLFLHYVNELPVKKTAALLERKVSTVKMQLVRGKKLLLQALRGQENE